MGYKYCNGKRNIGGTAALLHKIKRDGGLENRYAKIIAEFVDCVIEKGNQEIKSSNIKIIK